MSYRTGGRERLCSYQIESVKTEKPNVRNGSSTKSYRESLWPQAGEISAIFASVSGWSRKFESYSRHHSKIPF